MGCLNSKPVPEVPTNSGLVPVYGQSNEKPGKEVISTQPQPVKRKEKPGSEKKNTPNNKNCQPEPTLSENNGISKSLQPYKAKFDQRVTAKYDIKALIGKGTYSRVVRVENRMTKQPYAIKMVDRVRGKDMCESELNVLRRVRHANVIQLIEVFESTNKLYMVVELATGGELFDRIISKGSFVESDAIKVLRMVLDGIRYLHSLGITHRDLKPENLLYYHPGSESKILISDFGMSAFRRAGDECMNTTCGTPEYIAPEILARQPYTCQVDMWAVGVITYILLSGTMPFDDENRARLYRLILKANYNYDEEHWKDVSAKAKQFIDKLLVTDPTERMSALQALKHDWMTTPVSNSKDLHQTISKNIMERTSIRLSDKSGKSSKSNRSAKSLRSDHRRVAPEEIDELHRDPEIQAELSSIAGSRTRSVSSDN